MACPLPPSGVYVESVRDSAAALRRASGIKIDTVSVHRLLRSQAFQTSFQRVSQNHGLALPLKFPSFLAELNCIAILSLLNFGSGYRIPLHQETGRGAWDNMRALVMSMYISSSGDVDYMSAQGMLSIDTSTIAQLMQVSIHVERPYGKGSPITVGSLEGPLYDLVCLIQTTLNDTGRVLVQGGYPNLGSFVAEALKEGAQVKARGPTVQTDMVLERLVRAFPAFQDMCLVNGQPIYCFKKALFLLMAIHRRFSHLDPAPFDTPAVDHLPVFADNVLPSLLIHLGVLDITPCLSLRQVMGEMCAEGDTSRLLETAPSSSPSDNDKSVSRRVPQNGGLLSKEQGYLLRAAAIEACELIVAEARNIELPATLQWIRFITLPQVDLWLWAVAKDRADYRALSRFVERGTAFF